MRRFILVITSLLLSTSLSAQNEANRLLLHNNGTTKGFIINQVDSLTFKTEGDNIKAKVNINGFAESYDINNIDSISFTSVPGAVAANIEIVECSLSGVVANITRTPSCEGFKITCFPSSSISAMSDDILAQYVNVNVSQIYYDDYSNVNLNASFQPNTDYALVTAGFDKYGLLCDVVRAPFRTPSEDLVGNPEVEVEILENNLYDFTLRFTPNEDVSKYSILLGEAGVLESQYSMFASAYGWSNMGEMIEDWGLDFTGEETYQWTDKAPNTEYEVFIQMRDNDNNMAPYEVFEFKSKNFGGEGVAEVEITLGEYTLTYWEGSLLPAQFITFTPNDQTSAYRINVVLAENYDADVEGYKEDLCSDPFMPTQGWFQYEELTTDYQIDPNTSCVAIAAAKNANDEWGPVTELRFTTPASVENSRITTHTLTRTIAGRNPNILNNREITIEILK